MQEDGDGKEAKWADIDDDEDDWAPETIEWNDGTKINLAQMDQAAAIAEEQAASAALIAKEKEEEEEALKLKMRLAKPTSTVGPNATVLKLGSATLPRSGGLVLKAPSEKPTLVAKPSSSTTVKSPWASLPPVEKISPIPINSSPQSTTPRFSSRDPHGFDAMLPPPPHAKEIAADDFSRSSRETRNGLSRELFNFQSGRYDPVPETRRGSIRKEQNFRAPALLQRPSQGDQSGPAEPSPAFQTNRSGNQPELGNWNRRRTSSNLSGDSGNLDRRMSLGKALELSRIPDNSRQQSRDSLRDRSPMTPGLSHTKWAQRGVSPADSRGQSIASQSPTVASAQQHVLTDSVASSPQQSKVVPEALPTPPSVMVDQDPVAIQKKLMREKREAAIKRKKEEEEKEEAERRARISKKMEQLGLTDEKMGKKVTSEEIVPALPAPPVEKQDVVVITPRSPPKPPLPDSSGTPQQYGLMKLHGPQPINGLQAKGHLFDKEPHETSKHVGKPLHADIDTKPDRIQDTTNVPSKSDSDRKSPEKSVQISSQGLPSTTQDSRVQPWKGAPQESNGYAPWSSSHSMTTHSSPTGNLWGPLSHHRALGNGDFNPNLQRVHTRQHQYTQHLMSPPPPPIGSPRNHQSSYGMQQASSIVDTISRNAAEHSQTVPTYPSPEASPPVMNGQARVQQPQSSTRVDHHIQPNVGLENFASKNQALQVNETKRSGLAAWADFGVTVAKQEAEAARWAEERRQDIVQELHLPTMTETWRQVKMGESVGERQVVAALKSQTISHSLVPSPENSKDISNESISRGSGLSSPAPAPATSRSRFFSAGQAIAPHGQRAVSNPIVFHRPLSPPPPESADHPAYLGVHARPTVNLPFLKPKPTVKLPPLSSVPKSIPAAIEAPLPALRVVSQPLAKTNWQDRFNGLFDRKVSPEKQFAQVANFSTSKVPLEITSIDDPAIITLPPPDDEPAEDVPNHEPTKAVEDEDALFEERDFGSVPTVRIPNREPIPEWQRVKPSKFFKAHFKKYAEVEVQSIPQLILGPENSSRGASLSITVKIRGMSVPKIKLMSRPYNHNTSRPQLNNLPRGNKGKGSKPRESSATYVASKPSSNPPTRPITQNNSSQHGRPKINPNISWARKVSAGPVQ